MVKHQHPRFAAPRVEAALRDTPVVAAVGPRQAGKTTLVRDLVRLPRGSAYVTLDDPLPLAAARADPDGFLAGYDTPLVIDEAQRVPDLFRAIKRSVDRRREPGRFLLTGSADIFQLPRLSETLAGRVEIITLWPLAQAEIEGRPARFVDAMFDDRPPAPVTAEPRGAVLERILRGGFPEVVDRPADRRGAWLESYAATVVQREIADIAALERLADLPRLLRLIAARSGTVLNVAELSRGVGLTHTTLTRYLAVLELAYLVTRLPAWSGSVSRRLLKHPKVLMVDPGLAAHLGGFDAARLLEDGRVGGALVESFAAVEILKLREWSATRARLFHYRTAGGAEVDLVLERADGRLVAIEVKASERLEARDVSGIRALAADAGRRFVRGVVLYLGRDVVPFDRAIHAVPITALWRMGATGPRRGARVRTGIGSRAGGGPSRSSRDRWPRP